MNIKGLYLQIADLLEMQRVGSGKQGSILDKSLSRGKSEVNFSTFALLFAEMIRYANNRSNTVSDLQDKLLGYGKFVGSRLLDVIVLREKGYRRETKLLNMLMFVKGTIWKNLFNKEADKLERSNDDPCQYLLIEKEPIVNTYISVPKDKGNLNCASFIAGIIEAVLEEMRAKYNLSAVRKTWSFAATRWYTVEINSPEQPSTSKKNASFSLKKIDLVPERLHRHLFGNFPVPENTLKNDPFEALDLPNLEGSNLLDHFQNIAIKQFEPYRRLLLKASTIQKLPDLPKEWIFHPGWTRYEMNESPKQVDQPLEDLIFFDVEVCVRDGLLPTLATAVTPKAWYSWCSDRLVNGGDIPELYRLNHLIAFETDEKDLKHRLIIGHNGTNTRFWDTMSMAIPIYGMADHQVALYEKKDTEVDDSGPIGWIDYWRSLVCKNSLSALHEKLCGSTSLKPLNKSLQTFFVKEPIDEIRRSFQDLTTYCAYDVIACFELYQVLYPEFTKRFPHPVTWQGMLEIGNVYLPITKNWRKFFDNNETRANNENKTAAIGVIYAAKELVEKLEKPIQSYKYDPWMWSVDWSCRRGEKFPMWYESLLRTRNLIYMPVEKLSQADVKLKSRVVPRLFGLCWGPYPLHYKTDKGWGFLTPKDSRIVLSDVPEMEEVVLRRGVKATIPVKMVNMIMSATQFQKLSSWKLKKVSYGRSDTKKSFQICVEQETPHDFGAIIGHFFWDRFQEQVTVWLDENGDEGAIAPSIIPAGTVTRRAVHKLWLTAINPKDDQMIGTNLKSMVECPQDWHIVGADVDSQEQWIAAMLGDCCVGKGIAGATPFSNMLLAGRKTDHSDLHSVIAKEVGISRDKAKVLNYARLYGSGVIHAAEFLMQSGMNAEKALSISNKLLATTKGKRFKKLTLNFEDWLYESIWNKLRENGQDEVDFSKDCESDTFNYLELTLNDPELRTPVLDCQLGYCLTPLPKDIRDHEYFLKKYRRSIINWVVQSSAVDFLHLLIVCMKWLCEIYQIEARFALSIHDEIRYIVPAEDRYRCALALSLSNMYVRAMISQKLGIKQLPMVCRYQVDIDRVLRKEVNLACTTPSGECIPPGEALDMNAILMKTGGTLKKDNYYSEISIS
ncbi:DNA-directed DNA polymerase [Onchocerca flexuosa]|uniref:DNA-directed DNA polymerase n=1 Tax=Onchocerca flexuosa TaxID=387005 RepID=A0A238BMN3_9BILA|nr:DNA-directed DNA polymerase [Onchocerca flexuosa]